MHAAPPTGAVSEDDEASLRGELADQGGDGGGRQTGLPGDLGLRQLTVETQGRQHSLAIGNSKR